MSLYSNYLYYFDEMADKRVQDWPFMFDPFPTLFITILYLLTVTKWGPRFMENRNPYNLKNIIRSYNIFQIVCCTILFFGIGFNSVFTGEISLFCALVDRSDNPKALRVASYLWWLYLLKIAELSETIFFVLRKKYNQVSYLHLYHHASTLIFVWVGVKYVPGGLVVIPVLINCFVHFIMYGYYFLSTFSGPELDKILAKWKNKITVLQMIQFTVVIAYTLQIFRSDCDFPRSGAYIFIPNVALVFYMFYTFYKQAYNKKVE